MCLQSTIHCAKLQKRKILHKYKRKNFLLFSRAIGGNDGRISESLGGNRRCARVGIGRYEIKKSNSISELLFIRRRRHTLPQQV